MQRGRSKARCRGGRPLGPSPPPPGRILDQQARLPPPGSPSSGLRPSPTPRAPPRPRPLSLLFICPFNKLLPRQGPLGPGASFAGRRRTKQSPGGSQRIPGLGLAPPPTPAHLLLSPGPRPSTSTLLSFPGRLRPVARGSESRAASLALMVQAGSSPSWACAVWRTPPHPRATLSTPRQVGGEGSEWPGVDKALCLPGHISPLSSVPPAEAE